MEVPNDLIYTKEHEWAQMKDDVATIGVTDYAQGELGDIVFMELPEVGDETTQGEPFGTIEAVKAVSDLFSPFTGEIVEVNENLNDEPELINKDPYGDGWMVKIKLSNMSEKDSLLPADDYKSLID